MCVGEYRGPRSLKAFRRYAEARRKREVEEFAYRSYVCDSLKLAQEGKVLTKKWADIVRPQRVAKIDGNKVLASLIERGAFS